MENCRSCSTKIKDGDVIDTVVPDVKEAQVMAMDKILYNHELVLYGLRLQ